MRVVVIALLLVAVSSVASRFGDYPDLSHAENLQIVHPKIYESVRKRRSVHANWHLTRTKVVKLGDWFVELDPGYNSFVAPDLKAEWFNADEFRSLKALVECRYYTGAVRGVDGSSRAAVTLCGTDVTAFVDFGSSAFFVEPLNDTSGDHVMYSSKGSLLRRKRSGYQNYFISDIHNSKQWIFNLTGDTIDIGEDDDEIHQTKTLGNNKNSQDNATRNDSSHEENNPQNRVLDWRREDNMGEDEGGYFLDSAWTANAIKSRKSSNNLSPARWLEIAVAVDHTLISFHGKDKVEKYVLSLLNIVSAIYQDPSLKANLKLVVTRLLLYDHKKHGTIRPGHAKKSLENVNNWNRRLYASLTPDQPKHDLAIWLTRSDIGGPSGYAPVAGVCDPKRSCALNRDEGLTSAFIIAHETAHVLGLTHDGDKKNDNDCEEEALEGSIMAPMVSATFNKFLWSECSRKEFWDNADKWFCLLNPPAGSEIIPLNATLETSFSMDEQCRMEFGDGYSMCRAFEIIEPCSHLWCGHQNSPTVCKTKKGPPLEGTECGFGKWCVSGYCEEVSNRAERIPIVLNPQDGGWGDWRPWGSCSRTCGIGVRFRSRQCNNPEPSYGGKYCEGEPEEWRICHLDKCPEPFVDIRALQCKQLPKIFNLEGPHDIWLPYESDEENKKCKFICVNSERKELYVTDENLLDGTPCSYEDADSICVQGKCEIIGCDGNRKSKLRRNKCGICGGNNTQCSDMNISKTRRLKKEASRVSVLPRMAREIKVEVNVTVYHSDNPVVALVLKNRRKKRYTVTIPNTIVHNKILEGAKFSYRKYNNQHSMWSKGPMHAEMVILIVVPEKELKSGINITFHTEYTIHKDFIVPSKRFKWIMGGWGPCTASCGGGSRRETTGCWDDLNKKLVKRTYCSLIQKPKLKSEKCNTFGCNFQWISGEWEPCTASCGTKGVQSREIYCVPSSVLNTILFKNNGTVSNLWVHMVNPNKCSGIKPTTMKTCNKEACPSYWNFGDWSQCSASCGSGTQTRSFFCPQPNNEDFFSCGDPPPSQQRVCSANYTRQTNHLCREKKLRRCTRDQSQYCSIALFQKYCNLNGFKRMCCKSCRNYKSVD